ncbi:MAG: hypothetical protein GY830_08810 [Bacteroidetes bacterium]|nr:hypothetical protein [Bacteroidota bacterium]
MKNKIYLLVTYLILINCGKLHKNEMQNNDEDKKHTIISSNVLQHMDITSCIQNDYNANEKWICNRCTYLNQSYVNFCGICDSKRGLQNQINEPINNKTNQTNTTFGENEGENFILDQKMFDKKIEESINSTKKIFIDEKYQKLHKILILGPMGVGKSLFINWIMGNKFAEYTENEEEQEFCLIENLYEEKDEGDNFNQNKYNKNIKIIEEIKKGPEIGNDMALLI